jgi:TolB-like protein/Flp pilus assembly protein TadD
MAEGGMGESSEAVAQPPGDPASARTVFLSYASADAVVADQVCQFLESHGLRCWMAPRDVKPGAAYADAIVRAINEASALVLVLSGAAMASEHVSREVERAGSKHKQIVAFRVDAANLSAELEYFLSRSQWIDAPALGMPAALNRLSESIGQASTLTSSAIGAAGTSAAYPVILTGLRSGRVSTRVLVAAVVLVGVAVAVGTRFWPMKRAASAAAAISDKSIAVLPFTDMSEKKDQKYFSDGLSEDLITALSQIPGLKVIGRTSSFNFRNSSDDSKTIGAKLGVTHLLEGSVRHAGDMVRVSAELINASDGSTQWSERYDRPYKDLFGLQDDLTRAVGGALKAHLMPRENASVLQTDRPPSGNLEAYNSVLEGKYYLARDTDVDTRKAIERFTRATQLDPRYAFAWSTLSRAWTDLGGYHVNLAAAPEAYAQARVAANTALSLAPDLASAHIARGWLLEMGDLDWRGAETEYRRALELTPESGDAAAGLARQLANFGQAGRAIELTQQALATDPLHSRWYGWLAGYLSALNRLEEAEVAIRRAINLQPGGVRLHFVLSEIETRRGNAQAALVAAQQEPLGSFFRDAALAKALQSGNDRAAANAALKNLLDKGPSWDPYDVAQIYAMRNDSDKTFEWLDHAWSYRDPAVHYLPYDPFIGRFKDDPRFIAYCRKIGLPAPAAEER